VYREYVKWQRSREAEVAAKFWRTLFEGIELPTPIGIEDESIESEAGHDAVSKLFSAELSEVLSLTARSSRISLNTIVQGVWGLLLSRYSGRSQVVYGVTLSGRALELAGIEQTIGLFITTLPLALSVKEETPIGQWLAEVQEIGAEISGHQFCTVGQVHAWTTASGGTPLFESLMVFENYPMDRESFTGLGDADLRYVGARTNYPITLIVTPGRQIHISLIYQGETVPRAQANLILDDIERVATAIADAYQMGDGFGSITLQNLCPEINPETAPRIKPRGSLEGAVALMPRNRTELRLAQMWEELLGVGSIGVRQSFFELGGHSLLSLHLASQVQEVFGVPLSLSVLLRNPTIEGIAQAIGGEAGEPADAVLLAGLPGAANLFFVPGASGNVFSYMDLARQLADRVAFYGLPAPEFSGQSGVYSDIESLASHHCKAIRTVQPDGPYLLSGHSFGAAVAYEIARQLATEGEEVPLLAILDLPNPETIPNIPADRSDAEWMADIADAASRFMNRPIRIPEEGLASMSAEDQRRWFLDALIEAGIAPPDARPEIVATAVEVYRTSTDSLARYKPKPYSGSIDVFKVETEEPLPTDLGWERVGPTRLSIHSVPGDHITMIAKPNVSELARSIGEVIVGLVGQSLS